MSESPARPRPGSRAWLALIWLVFLLDPLQAAWKDRDQLSGIVGLAATIGFAGAYAALWFAPSEQRLTLILKPSVRVAVPYLGGLVVLGALMIATLGQPGTAAAVYVAVACVVCLPPRLALVAVMAITVAVAFSGRLPGWHSQTGTAVGVVAAALAVFGFRTVLQRNLQLYAAQDENTRLAVENERNRVARDIHDILGHSLTVITVKAELAQRLLDSPDEPARERARAEVADLERLSRDALADVRRTVSGYREVTLPGELAQARAALTAAGLTAVVPQSTDEVGGDLRELFAWTVREGVTNVLRHAAASRCEIRLSPTSVEVRDDGRGPEPSSPAAGNGLAGLRERAAAVGAVVTTGALDPGFVLRVESR